MGKQRSTKSTSAKAGNGKNAAIQPGDTLTDKERKIVDCYIANNFNKTAAYIEAGYSAPSRATAASNALKVLGKHHVQVYLQHRLKEAMLRCEIEVNQDRIVKELNTLAYCHIGQLCEWSLNQDTGEIQVKYFDSADLSPEILATIKKIKVTRRATLDKEGREVSATTTMELEQHDKKSALEILSRCAGLVSGDKNGNQPIHMNFNFNGDAPKEPPIGRVIEHER